MVVVELVTGPPEELDGLTREPVGELEDFFDVFPGDTVAGFVEGFLDGEGRGGGDYFA